MLRGVNLAGAEFASGRIPGVYGTDYAYQAPWAGYFGWRQYANVGMNVVRIPFRWERLQRTLQGEFDAGEWIRLQDTVSDYRALGVNVILDPHNYGSYKIGDPVTHVVSGSISFGSGLAAADLADLWARIALKYKNDHGVIFGLMNEPAGFGAQIWFPVVQTVIDEIRSIGASNLILVPGVGYTGAHAFVSNGSAAAALTLTDPASNLVFEVHQYFDKNNSGADGSAVSAMIGIERVAAFENWCAENGKKGFLGEFGISKGTCAAAGAHLLNHISQRRDVWAGWTAWGAGGRWSSTYHFILDVPFLPQAYVVAQGSEQCA